DTTRGQWLALGRMAVQDRVPPDTPALDLIHPEHAAAFCWLPRFAFMDNRGVGLEQAHHFLRGGHDFPWRSRRVVWATTWRTSGMIRSKNATSCCPLCVAGAVQTPPTCWACCTG